ncbi:tetratricopeptide repeat protein [Accumulibacter sp.]|uniref:tetratricopeptide repeat protein n=1 Tax=Accumulibacter sp. TaxID=2053492 RepID=UPI0026261726|nr:tetratricopeptide repeat protein [Accumulibacter sp.]
MDLDSRLIVPWRPETPLRHDELNLLFNMHEQVPHELKGVEFEFRNNEAYYLRQAKRGLWRRIAGRFIPSESSRLAERLTQMGDQALKLGHMDVCTAAYSLSIRLRFFDLPVNEVALAVSAQDLAWGWIRQGKFAEAEDLLKWVIQLRIRVLGSAHPETLGASNDLASVMREHGDFAGARSLQETVLADCRRVLGFDHPHTLTVADNLCLTLQDLGALDEARSLGEQVLSAEEHVLGSAHSATIITAGNLALVMKAQGDFASARQLEERALTIHKQLDGAEAPTTLMAAGNLAVTMRKQGDVDEAKKLQDWVLTISERVLGPVHPDTTTAACQLAETLLEYDVPRAKELFEHAFVTRERQLGRDNPATMAARDGLARAMHALGDFAGARALHEYNLAVEEQLRGPDHPEVLSSANNLAATLHDQGDLVGARALQERVYSSRERVLGVEHPLTLLAAGNLAAIMHAQGNFFDAKKLQERVLDVTERLLGPSHPNSYTANFNLAATMMDMGEVVQASEISFRMLRRLANTPDIGGGVFEHALVALLVLEKRVDSTPGSVDVASLLQLIAEVSHNLQSLVELREVRTSTTLTNLVFQSFHQKWLDLCVRFAPERCIEAIAPLHGLEAWSTLSNQIRSAPAIGAQSAEQRRFLETRASLNAIRARISDIDTKIMELLSVDDSGTSQEQRDRGKGRMTRLRTERQVEASKERNAMAQYEVAKNALIAVDPTFASAVGTARIAVPDLIAHLATDETVVILFQSFTNEHGALAITADGRCNVIRLHRLNDLIRKVRRFASHRRGTYRGLRDCLGAEELDAAEPMTDDKGALEDFHKALYQKSWRQSGFNGDAMPRCWGLLERIRRGIVLADTQENQSQSTREEAPLSLASLTQAVAEDFWQPLRNAFLRINRWHVVTGPGQHDLPLDLGRYGFAARYYCGLPGYWRLSHSSLPFPERNASIDITVDAAWGTTSPIPFVECEAALVKEVAALHGAVLQKKDGAVLLNSSLFAPRVHVACHGRAMGDEGRKHGVLLLDAAAEVVLEPAQVLHLRGDMAEFFASSCLGGLVGHTAGGDALGMIPPLQLRGLPAIVACLTPAPDFYMPLLVAFYWHRRMNGVLPHAALDQAKSQMRSGAWPTELITPVRNAYCICMTDVLSRAAGAHLQGNYAAANAAVIGVASWCLPEELRIQYFSRPAFDPSSKRQEDFVENCCASTELRDAFVDRVASRFVAGRHNHPAEAREAIELVCAYTICFGDVSPSWPSGSEAAI